MFRSSFPIRRRGRTLRQPLPRARPELRRLLPLCPGPGKFMRRRGRPRLPERLLPRLALRRRILFRPGTRRASRPLKARAPLPPLRVRIRARRRRRLRKRPCPKGRSQRFRCLFPALWRRLPRRRRRRRFKHLRPLLLRRLFRPGIRTRSQSFPPLPPFLPRPPGRLPPRRRRASRPARPHPPPRLPGQRIRRPTRPRWPPTRQSVLKTANGRLTPFSATIPTAS